MRLINKDSYLLNTGKIIHPNNGIIGLTEVENEYKIHEGYDGGWITEQDLYEGCQIKADLTNEELKEIAAYMSQLWQKWLKQLEDNEL